MKKVVWTLGVLVLTGGIASAQDTNELVPTAPVVYETTFGLWENPEPKPPKA